MASVQKARYLWKWTGIKVTNQMKARQDSICELLNTTQNPDMLLQLKNIQSLHIRVLKIACLVLMNTLL